MWRPGTAALSEADVVGWMPVAGSKDRNAFGARFADPSVQHGDNFVPCANAQSASRTKVILNVDD